MELIKQIKQAEQQTKDIVEQAKAGAAKKLEQAANDQTKQLAEAELQRKKAIQTAIEAGRNQGTEEAKKLTAQANENRKKLHQKAAEKMPAAVAKLMEYLKG